MNYIKFWILKGGDYLKVYCEDCDGLGYHEYPDYDYDENILDTGTRIECDSCAGQGYGHVPERTVLERMATYLLSKDIDEDICSEIDCNIDGDMYECINCIINFFSRE